MHWFHVLGSLKNLTIDLIWLVTRRAYKPNNWSDLAGDEEGVGGEVWGGGPGRRARGLTRCGVGGPGLEKEEG